MKRGAKKIKMRTHTHTHSLMDKNKTSVQLGERFENTLFFFHYLTQATKLCQKKKASFEFENQLCIWDIRKASLRTSIDWKAKSTDPASRLGSVRFNRNGNLFVAAGKTKDFHFNTPLQNYWLPS